MGCPWNVGGSIQRAVCPQFPVLLTNFLSLCRANQQDFCRNWTCPPPRILPPPPSQREWEVKWNVGQSDKEEFKLSSEAFTDWTANRAIDVSAWFPLQFTGRSVHKASSRVHFTTRARRISGRLTFRKKDQVLESGNDFVLFCFHAGQLARPHQPIIVESVFGLFVVLF